MNKIIILYIIIFIEKQRNNISLFRISIMSLRRPNKSLPSTIQHKLKENTKPRFNSVFTLNNVKIVNKEKENKEKEKEKENKEKENKEKENKEKEKEKENKEKENKEKENKEKENKEKENKEKEKEKEKENKGKEKEEKEKENKEKEEKEKEEIEEKEETEETEEKEDKEETENKEKEEENKDGDFVSVNVNRSQMNITMVDDSQINLKEIVETQLNVVKVNRSQVDVVKIDESPVKVSASNMGISRVGKVCGILEVDKIYCINLQSCKERKDHMKKEFLKNNFNATFVNAIHPRHTEHKRKYTNPKFVDQGWLQPRCYCVQQGCGHRPRKLRSTEVAISLSHNNIYLNIVNNNIKWSLVCEDDLIFANNFCDIVNSLVPSEIWNHQSYKLSDDPDNIIEQESPSERPIIIFLGGARDNMGLEKTNVSQFKLKRMPNGVYSNYCYLINLEAAKFFSRKFYPITRPEDSFKRYWISKGRIDCYRVNPSIIAELSAGTNMPSIYNRWSLGKVAPGTAGEPSKEYKPVEKNSTGTTLKKTRRKITYKKFTKLSNTQSK
jgi:GR25 family glycosyltransferase involved in LPS biosynthesis